MRLCGISSHFWLLSPCTGQVTHALLTRPPLSHTPEGVCFVRLACVRHAASVHPEPGSNSHLKRCPALRRPSGLPCFSGSGSKHCFVPWTSRGHHSRSVRMNLRKTALSLLFELNVQGCSVISLSKRESAFRCELPYLITEKNLCQTLF